MDKYLKVKWKDTYVTIEYELLEEETLIENEKLQLRFPEGGFVICKDFENRNEKLVIGIVKQPENFPLSSREILNYLVSNSVIEDDKNIYMKYLSAFPKTNLIGSHWFYEKECYAEGNVFEKYAFKYTNIYGAKDDEIQFFVCRGKNAIMLYGSSIEKVVDTEELREKYRLGVEPKVLTYKEFLEEKESYQLAKRGEESNRLVGIRNDINQWLKDTTFNEFEKAITSRVKGQEGVPIICAFIYKYLIAIASGKKIMTDNILLAAPSGCGKTETYRVLKSYFSKHLPKIIVDFSDMSNITEAAFRGKDPYEVVSKLYQNPECGGIGIIFLDEFDKKLMPTYTSHGENISANVQAQLLAMIEGTEIESKAGNDHGRTATIDTSNTMFIASGSFDACRKKHQEIKRACGFGNEEEEVKDHYEPITKQDMIELGASYELLGRFVTVVNYHKLSDEIVDEIIDDMVKSASDDYGIDIEITEDFRNVLFEHANSKYGCRELKNVFTENVIKGYLEVLKSGVPFDECAICIDEDNVSVSHINQEYAPRSA